MKVYIITSAKFEECYIEEWVKYHLSIGFDKIIINDNNPSDYIYDIKNILQKYINEGTVIVERYYDTHSMPNNLTTPDADISNIYLWLYNKYKNEFDWFAKLDIDEYLEIPETNNNVKLFLSQNKFNNVLSLVIPFKHFSIKPEYSVSYVKLNNDKDRFTPFTEPTYTIYDFKTITRKSKFVSIIGLHYPYFTITNNDNYILYGLSNGEDATKRLLIGSYKIQENIINEYLKNNNKFIRTELLNSCHINHYCWKSAEERVNHCIKFDANKYTNWHLYQRYKDLYNEFPNFFNNPRDLYKIYFLDNESN